MVSIDFGDFPGVDMRDPVAQSDAVLVDFDAFDFVTGEFDGVNGILEIPNTAGTAFVLAHGQWAFDIGGNPVDESVVQGIEVWVPGASAVFDYRVVIDGFSVFFPTLETALLDSDLSALYAGQPLEIFGTQTHADTLVGGELADEIYGFGGNDVLIGRAGNDYLDGMAGRDIMRGGGGNDDYAVTGDGDAVIENGGAGIDLVLSSITYRLPANVEDLALLDEGGAIDGLGNGRRNFIEGNGSANRLRGAGAGDTMDGFAGDDTVEGGAGHDLIAGGEGADLLLGGGGDDTLFWGAGDAGANGGAGVDTLALESASLNLRRTPNDAIVEVERVSLAGEGANRLILNARDVLDLSSTTNVLRVLGDAGDTVSLHGSFAERGTAGGFTRYKSGAAVVLIDSDIAVV